MDRGNSRNGSVPVMSTQPIGQSVIDMTSVCVCVCFSLARDRMVAAMGKCWAYSPALFWKMQFERLHERSVTPMSREKICCVFA